MGRVLKCYQEHLASGREVLYLCQDETRVGLKTLQGKVITAKGVKPVVEVQGLRENFWLYGAISPQSGEYFLQERPKLNGENFQSYLDWLSKQLGERYAVLQVDQAPAHTSHAIEWPDNIIPLFQPAHSPELNPIERLWQWLKRPMKNQSFPSLDELRTRVEEIFEELTLKKAMSLSGYDFIWDALFYAASC
ncbi:MAG: IS630 family transposase [Acaryochloridaceae cyanobacterium RL_2_7]|nr:IS630 family transposase [Acaryochloridaceae cyanobacterium RL_2_7]